MKVHYFKFVGALFLAVFFLAACSSSNEETVVKDFYSAVSAGNTDKAVSMMDFSDVPEKDRALANAKFVAMLEEAKNRRFDPHGGVKSVEISDKRPSSDGNRIAMSIVVTFNDGTTRNESITVVKVDNEWKIVLK